MIFQVISLRFCKSFNKNREFNIIEGIRQEVKAHDFDSCISRFESEMPCYSNNLLGVIFMPIFRKDVIILDYIIVNPNKTVYIRLNEKGSPEACVKQSAQRFDNLKAKNILNNLPKTMKRFHFKIEPTSDSTSQEENNIEPKVIQGNDYVPSENITRWVEKFGTCADILNEAKQREEELIKALNNIDKDILNILHSVELEKSKDMYGGWQEYKKIKSNREKRRVIKDELLIVENVLKEINPDCMQRERVQKAIDGLFNRKYKFRIIEET